MPEPAGAGGESSRTLDRGIRLLELLAAPDAAAGRTITELAAALGVGRPVVYRLVSTLEQHRLVSRREGGRVRLGYGLTRLAARVTPVVQAEVLPVLRRLADDAGATAHLTVADGEEALALVVVEPSWTDVHVAYRSGSRHPLGQGAAGRAILAGRAGRFEVVGSDGELQSGAHGLAVALRPERGEPHDASVGVVSLEPLATQVISQLVVAAGVIGELMG